MAQLLTVKMSQGERSHISSTITITSIIFITSGHILSIIGSARAMLDLRSRKWRELANTHWLTCAQHHANSLVCIVSQTHEGIKILFLKWGNWATKRFFFFKSNFLSGRMAKRGLKPIYLGSRACSPNHYAIK